MPAAVRAAAITGALASVLCMIPVRGAFLFLLPLAGFLAALLYARKVGQAVSAGTGFELGALTGLFASATLLILNILGAVAAHAGNQLRDAMIQSIHQAQLRAPDQQTRLALEYFLTPHGMLVMMILGCIFIAVLCVLLGGAGGAIFAALSRNKSPSE